MAPRSASSDDPHDILAAEAFAVGEGDRELHREPAHDVLAAEEFALPAPERHAVPPGYTPSGGRSGAGLGSKRGPIALTVLALLWLRRRRRR